MRCALDGCWEEESHVVGGVAVGVAGSIVASHSRLAKLEPFVELADFVTSSADGMVVNGSKGRSGYVTYMAF